MSCLSRHALLALGVALASQGCASAAGGRRVPTQADSANAVLSMFRTSDDYWRYLQISKPDLATRGGARVTTLAGASPSNVNRDGRFARAGIAALDQVYVDALPQDTYVTWLTYRWEMEAMAGWPAYNSTRIFDLAPGNSIFDRAIEVLSMQDINGPGAGQRFLGLLNSLPSIIRDARDDFLERARDDIRPPRLTIDRMAAHVRSLRADAASSLFGLPRGFVVTRDTAWRAQLGADVATVIDDRVNPMLDSLVVAIESERERASDDIGLARLPGGLEHYEALLRYHSTIDITAADAHAIGLREVARLAALTTDARNEAGLPAHRDSLRAALAADSQYAVSDAASMLDVAAAIHAALVSELDSFFPPNPSTRLSIGVQPDSEGPSELAIYEPPTIPTMAATYLIHPGKLASRSLLVLPSLIAGDLMPGVHRQRAIQFENVSLPFARRFSEHTGFVKGWQLYALHVTDSLSRSINAAQRYGIRMRELAAACGLVVDTGINAFGWTRDAALAFLREYLPLDDEDLEPEFLIPAIETPGMPGAGTLGAREFRGLRLWVERELGTRFDLGAFHRELLRVGSVPLPVLGSHLERWIWEQNRPAPEAPPPTARR